MKNMIFSGNLEIFNFGTSRTGRREGYYMTICQTTNIKSKTYRVSFSEDVRALVDEKNLHQINIASIKCTNELMIVFLNSEDPQVLSFGRESTGQIRILNKQLVRFFKERLNIAGDNFSVKIELSNDVSNSDDYATFKVIKHL